MRDSIAYPLKAALVVLTMIAVIAGIIVIVQSSICMNPTYFDTDKDGFHDVGEIGWYTSRFDPNDNPFTTRVMPVALAAMATAILLVLGKIHRKHGDSNLAPVLRKQIDALRAAVASRNGTSIDACKGDFDKVIMDIRSGMNRDALKEPSIQHLLVEFELLGLDAAVDRERPGHEPDEQSRM